MIHEKRANADAIQIIANMVLPKVASILTSVLPSKTFFIMTNMTVATTVAISISAVLRNPRKPMANAAHLLNVINGLRKMSMNERQAPAKKKANMTLLASLMMSSTRVMSEGSCIDAPASSWLEMISTGLNQYRVCGLEHEVMPRSR